MLTKRTSKRAADGQPRRLKMKLFWQREVPPIAVSPERRGGGNYFACYESFEQVAPSDQVESMKIPSEFAQPAPVSISSLVANH